MMGPEKIFHRLLLCCQIIVILLFQPGTIQASVDQETNTDSIISKYEALINGGQKTETNLCRLAEAYLKKFTESGKGDNKWLNLAYERALDAKIKNAEAPLPYLLMSTVYMYKGNITRARNLADRANSLTSDNPAQKKRVAVLLKQIESTPAVAEGLMDLKKWEPLSGDWAYRGNSIFGSGTGHLILRENLNDFIMRVRIDCSGSDTWTIGIGFRGRIIPGGGRRFRRSTADIEGYSFNFSDKNNYNLFKYAGGEWLPLNPDRKEWLNSDLLPGIIKNIVIEGSGNVYRIFVNDQLLTEFADSTFTKGSPFIYSGRAPNTVRLSEIQCQQLAPGKVLKNYADGSTYFGMFVNGKKEGQGSYTWADGSRYVGDFKGGRVEGQGIKKYASGDIYSGGWLNNRKHGKGTMFYPKNGRRETGVWQNGKKVK